jgi:hypothetical protein
MQCDPLHPVAARIATVKKADAGFCYNCFRSGDEYQTAVVLSRGAEAAKALL